MSSEEWLKKNEHKKEQFDRKLVKQKKPIGADELTRKFTNLSFQFSFPVFDSKKEYALVYMTDANNYFRACVYLCHLIGGKFDKICFKDCWEYEI